MSTTTHRNLSKKLVSANLRRLLAAGGLSQADLARAVCGDASTLSRIRVHRWVMGKILPTPCEQMELATALDCDIAELFHPEKKSRKIS